MLAQKLVKYNGQLSEFDKFAKLSIDPNLHKWYYMYITVDG